MSIGEIATVDKAHFAKLAVMAIRAGRIHALELLRTTERSRLVHENQLLAARDPLAVHIVAILASLTLADQVVGIAVLAKCFGTFGESAFGARIGTRQVDVNAFVVGVDEHVFANDGFLGRYADRLGSAATLTDSGPRCPQRRSIRLR